MPQNENQIIDRFVGNLSNVIVHRILEKAIEDTNITNKYIKEVKTSLDIAKRYREQINPKNKDLPDKDISYIKEKIILKVKSELAMRISKGYTGINTNLIEPFVDGALRELN